jgi:1-acyl-sn-glycerol-3-phosphate acyltransferase
MLPQIPPAVPRRGGAVTRLIGRVALRAMGWRVDGGFPNSGKFVLIAAPHRTNWDFVVGLAAKFALALDVSWLGKHTLFVGPWGFFFRRWGGMPVDRRSSNDTVAVVADQFASREKLLLAIAPEGTRAAGARWKTGFWHIAHRAGVPIVPFAFDWPNRVVRIMPPLVPQDIEKDLVDLQERYRVILAEVALPS